MEYDLIVVGGSFAGLAAASQMARALRSVLVIDSGSPRNRFAEHAHGFLGQDGRPPKDILDDARHQLMAYPTVTLVNATAVDAALIEGGFVITIDTGLKFTASRLVLATGVRDILPDVPGLAEHWGTSILHCPYCHGFEVAGCALGVLATSDMALHQAKFIAEWGNVTLFSDGTFVPDTAQSEELKARGIAFDGTGVTAIDSDGSGGLLVRMADGRNTSVKAIFTAVRTEMSSPLAEQLGCVFTDGMMGPVIKVDERQQTSVPGVYAAGDAARALHTISFAVSEGAWAGIAAHQSLVFK